MPLFRVLSPEILLPPSPVRCLVCAMAWVFSLGACGADGSQPALAWSVVVESPEAALLSVSGTSPNDVWMVGADDGSGPLVLHWDGALWVRVPLGSAGPLWWVHALSADVVYAGGSGGQVWRATNASFERLPTPGIDTDVVFGVWAAAETDVYAVGSSADQNGFLWHDGGAGFAPVRLPEVAGESPTLPSLFKVWGTSSSDVWVVGERGVVLRGNAQAGFALVSSGSEERLFTVHASDGQVVMVGGSANGVALESTESGLRAITPPGAGPLQGTCVSAAGDVWAVGLGGNAHVRRSGQASWTDLVPSTPVQSLHAVWVDPGGAAWAVGGNVLVEDLDRGVALRHAANAEVPIFHPTFSE